MQLSVCASVFKAKISRINNIENSYILVIKQYIWQPNRLVWY